MLNIDLLRYLNYGAIGVGVGLAGLSYNLLMKAQDNPDIHDSMIHLIWGFMILSTLIIMLAFFKEMYDRSKRKGAAEEVDPANPKIWGSSENFEFKWFNAPYGLAVTELGKMNLKKIKKKNVTYKLLLFEGIDNKEKEICKNRFEKMRDFLIHLEANGASVKDKMEVRVKKETPLPSLTFYTLKKQKKDTVVFYLGPCVESDGKAWKAFQTRNEAMFRRLNHEFQDHWDKAEKKDLDKLLLNN